MNEIMKPWLFDILACPIDKQFPLKLYIFSFENKPEEFQIIIDTYKKRDIELINKEKIIEVFQENNEYLLMDNIVIEKTILKSYLESIIMSINEFDNIFNNSPNQLSQTSFQIINSEIKPKILEFLKELKAPHIEDIFPELYFINKIKLDIEIESGILFCSKCKRWYPIIDTIPQMLPDKYRDERKEIEFLESNKILLDEKFLNQDLKPFNI